VHNLIDNAIKYGGMPPRVLIELRQEGNCKISIKDNGKGILKADRNFIFDKFYRISTGDIHDVKGFGLGLYYVKMMTKLLGGDIHLERSDDSGSTFVLEINDYEK
jgi:two-component system phosphate regulon sensor histidine kinase PhoR